MARRVRRVAIGAGRTGLRRPATKRWRASFAPAKRASAKLTNRQLSMAQRTAERTRRRSATGRLEPICELRCHRADTHRARCRGSERQQCSGYCRCALVDVLTLTGIKQSLDPTIGGGRNGGFGGLAAAGPTRGGSRRTLTASVSWGQRSVRHAGTLYRLRAGRVLRSRGETPSPACESRSTPPQSHDRIGRGRQR